MASNTAYQIAFKITEYGNGLKNLTVDAKDLAKVFKSAAVEAKKLNKPIIDFAAFATGIDTVNSVLSNLQGVMRGLSDAYAAQIEAETKLTTNMRNTMDARKKIYSLLKIFARLSRN